MIREEIDHPWAPTLIIIILRCPTSDIESVHQQADDEMQALQDIRR